MPQAFTMSDAPSRPRAAGPAVAVALLPIVAVVFSAFLVIGLALPVREGLGTFVVGLGNPKMHPLGSGDRVTSFGRGLPRLGWPSPGKAWVLCEVIPFAK